MRRILGMLAVAAPFVAAAIAAASARHDMRLAAMAVVATLTVWLVPDLSARPLASAGLIVGVATLIVTAVGMIAGARNMLGVLMVAVVVAAFAGAGRLLLRPHHDTAGSRDRQRQERRS